MYKFSARISRETMVHANLEFVRMISDPARLEFDEELDADADSEGALADALGKCVPQLRLVEGVDNLPEQVVHELLEEWVGDVEDFARHMNAVVGAVAESTARSNRELGNTAFAFFLSMSPTLTEYSTAANRHPIGWLRFARYVGSAVEHRLNELDMPEHECVDLDKDYIASICGVANRDNDTLYDTDTFPELGIRSVRAAFKLVIDVRRTYEKDASDIAHAVLNHGVMDVQIITGARFMEFEKYEKQIRLGEPITQPHLFVYKKEIELNLLLKDGMYYPDMRSNSVIQGIERHEPVAQLGWADEYGCGDKVPVYVNELYGCVDYNDLILHTSEVDVLPDRGQSKYYVKTVNSDDTTIEADHRIPHEHTAAHLYYNGAVAGAQRPLTFLTNGDAPVRAIDISYDGTPFSIYQLGARFGTVDISHSVLGCYLPIQIVAEAIVLHHKTLIARCAGMKLDDSVARDIQVRNAKLGLPNEYDMANALAREGRHNEVGIALQALHGGKQGDIMLYDGV
jgi:hypothetical protein